ncbi:MAG: [protein-PII] uridylyltransferase, partial [Burkholderiales bacterium]|nr:[protein-PII] uridylyltransferase [Burkholderiales bacterium]
MTIDIAAHRAQFRQAKTALLDQFAQSRPTTSSASRLLGHLAKLVDRTLHDLWLAHQLPKGAALVAVGGYGRGELFPHSDIDVLILVPQSLADSGDDTAISAVEGFISACWDIGLEIGSSVRTVQECGQEAAGDVTIQTSLLEARFLCGSKPRFTELMHVTAQKMDAQDFLTAKLLEMRHRHTKYEDTPYSLEPNCKESPGGLRDLQVVLWLARAANLGKTWHELAQKGLLTAFEARQLQRNEGVLKLIRARLHQVAGRREDRLVFDLQNAVAETFGYTNTPALRASEMLMRRYYWAAKAVTQLNQILILNIEERVHGSQNAPMRVINERFLDRGGVLEVVSDDLYQRDPHAILDTFLTFQTDNTLKGLSARTLRALYNAREVMDSAFRRDPVNRQTFMAILKAPQGLTRVIRLMNQTSVLGRYLWVFRRIVGQMQHDLFHVYTVDQHILMVVRNVRRFFIPEHAHEYPFCTQLASEWDKPWLLYIGALFHDVAKGRGGDHSELGAVEVRRFCKDHGVTGEDAKLAEFLVAGHLTMSKVAQKEDLSDPDVIQAFAQKVGNERNLTALYLLTVADIRGTSPKVWNAWKG